MPTEYSTGLVTFSRCCGTLVAVHEVVRLNEALVPRFCRVSKDKTGHETVIRPRRYQVGVGASSRRRPFALSSVQKAAGIG